MWSQRGDLHALLSLDDRTLADIGLRRAEVAAAASGQVPLSQLTLRGQVGPSDAQPVPSGRVAPAVDRSELERWGVAA
jgi:Domain of unknown function (DUF1127)